MLHPRYSDEEIERLGKRLYEQRIRALVETEQNVGKIVSIDIETGDYEIGEDSASAGKRLLARRPEAALYGVRIGYNAL